MMRPRMGNWINATLSEGQAAGTLWLFVLVIVNLILARPGKDEPRRVVVAPAVLFALHIVLLPIVGYFHARGTHLTGYTESRLPFLIFAALSGVMAVGSLLFNVLFPRVRLNVPRILRDMVIGAASLISVLSVASRAGSTSRA